MERREQRPIQPDETQEVAPEAPIPEELQAKERALREAYEARQKTITEQIENMRQKALEKRVEIKGAKGKIDFLEDKITIAQSKTLDKVFNFLKI
jgi:peptidoglycan hydrolase CwlO-like protein